MAHAPSVHAGDDDFALAALSTRMATRETQSLIIGTAIELFNRHGTGAVSTNRIAAACGISKGNLHYHFKNKQEIIQWIFNRAVEEMNTGWYRDHLQPTVQHMAEMFARQLQFILKYRFFYREMPSLLRRDNVLRRLYLENRERRLAALEQFFREMTKCGAFTFEPDSPSIRTLVVTTWIISDNWLNYYEFQGREIDSDAFVEGYDMILAVLRPHLTEAANRQTRESYRAITDFIRTGNS